MRLLTHAGDSSCNRCTTSSATACTCRPSVQHHHGSDGFVHSGARKDISSRSLLSGSSVYSSGSAAVPGAFQLLVDAGSV